MQAFQLAALALAALGGGEPPTAATRLPNPGPLLIWERSPTVDQIAALYPAQARAARVGGRVLMRCRVARDGTLSGCIVLSEAPQGYGFGAATLGAARYFRMIPRFAEERQPNGVVDVPLSWRLPLTAQTVIPEMAARPPAR
jgi:TonB family protein